MYVMSQMQVMQVIQALHIARRDPAVPSALPSERMISYCYRLFKYISFFFFFLPDILWHFVQVALTPSLI